MEFPVSLKQISKYPQAINVYGYENDEVYPLRISEKQT